MSSLYKNYNQKEEESVALKNRISTLSIEYNPLNQVKRDLGITNPVELKDMADFKDLMEIEELKNKFKGVKRVLKAEEIYSFCFNSDCILVPIQDYTSSFSDKALLAIENFSKMNNIDLSRNKYNFYVLCPLKYINEDNEDLSNVIFNIYYKDHYVSDVPKDSEYLMEVYGSDLKYSDPLKWKKFNNIKKLKPIEGVESSFVLALILFFIALGLLVVGYFTQNEQLFTAAKVFFGVALLCSIIFIISYSKTVRIAYSDATKSMSASTFVEKLKD